MFSATRRFPPIVTSTPGRLLANTAICLLMLQSAIPAFAIKPLRTYPRLPSDLGLSAEVVRVPTSDGFELAAWFIPATAARLEATVVVAYGDAGNMAFMLDYADAFSKHGFDVLLFDFRGFGESGSFPIDVDRLIYSEYLVDLQAALDFVATRSSGEILIYGQSMGATLAIAAAGNRGDVAGVVAEGPYTSTSEVLELINAGSGADERRFKPPSSFPDNAQPLTAVTHLSGTALMILAGSEDTEVTPDMACRLYTAACADPKSLWIAAGAHHGEIAPVYGEVFVEVVVAFMELAIR